MTPNFRVPYVLSKALLVALIVLRSSLAFGDDTAQAKIMLYTDRMCSKELAANFRDIEGDPASLVKNHEITLYYYDDKVGNVEFNETTRDAVFLAQLKELVSVVAKKQVEAKMVAPPAHCIPTTAYRLKFKRSNLQIIAKSIDGKSEQSFNMVTGPKEHWYLGFDLPVNSSKTLKYDQATKSLLPQDQNPQLYLSFNYSQTDVVAGKNTWSLKLLLLASSRPLDSVGLGIGYRLPDNIAGLGDLSALSLFAGRFWNKQDGISAGGDVQLNQSTGKDWRFGISYDFSTALPWIK